VHTSVIKSGKYLTLMPLWKIDMLILLFLEKGENMRKVLLVCFMVALVFALPLTAQGGNETVVSSSPSYEGWPHGKNITINVCSGAGGSTDLGVRLLLPYLQEQFDATFAVRNESGGSGWVCWLNHIADKPDGLSLILVNDTMDYVRLNPNSPHKESSDDFQLLACEVVDISALAIRTNDKRFSTYQELVEYAKKNQVTVAVSDLGNEDANVIYLMNNKLGTKFEPVVIASSGQAVASVIGGHVDVYSNNIASCSTQVKEGNLKPMVVFNGSRSNLWPDVPTFEEVTGIKLNCHSARGFMMPKGGDPALVNHIVDCLKKAIENPEFKKKMAETYLEVVYYGPEDFKKLFKEAAADVVAIKSDLGW